MALQLLKELEDHLLLSGNRKPGRRDGGLGQRIYNEIRLAGGSTKDKEQRKKLAAAWKNGKVAWKRTQLKLQQVKKKVIGNQMTNPLKVIKIKRKDAMVKLAFAPREDLKAKTLTAKQSKFLENQQLRGAKVIKANKNKKQKRPVSLTGLGAKTAVSLARDPLTQGSGGQGLAQRMALYYL